MNVYLAFVILATIFIVSGVSVAQGPRDNKRVNNKTFAAMATHHLLVLYPGRALGKFFLKMYRNLLYGGADVP